MSATVDQPATKTPVEIGACHHCKLPLYDAGPVARDPLAHIACVVDAARRDR